MFDASRTFSQRKRAALMARRAQYITYGLSILGAGAALLAAATTGAAAAKFLLILAGVHTDGY